MDVNGIEKDIETIVAEAQAALGPIQTLLTIVGPFLPPQVKLAMGVIEAVSSAAPAIIADLKKTVADVEAAIAKLQPPTA